MVSLWKVKVFCAGDNPWEWITIKGEEAKTQEGTLSRASGIHRRVQLYVYFGNTVWKTYLCKARRKPMDDDSLIGFNLNTVSFFP